MTVFAGIIDFNQRLSSQERSEFTQQFELLDATVTTTTTQTSHADILIHSKSIDASVNFPQDHKRQTVQLCGNILVPSIHDENGFVAEQYQKGQLPACLNSSRGTFSGWILDDEQQQLSIFSDKLGVRPVYIYQYDDVVIVSSILSFIKNLSFINKEKNVDALAEFIGLGYNTGIDTPFRYITRIDAAQLLTFSAKKMPESEIYWQLPAASNTLHRADNDNAIDELYSTYQEGVALRLNIDNDHQPIAFLSGGMDSRVVCASVFEMTQSLDTFNYSTVNSQDWYYAKKLSENYGFKHRVELFEKFSNANWSQLMRDSLSAHDLTPPSQLKYVWSGDGGSVGLGGVYVTKQMEELAEQGNNEAIINALVNKFGADLPRSFLHDHFLSDIKQTVYQRFSKQIKLTTSHAKGLYDFLMLNDQKRHLDVHFETIMSHKIELHLPFFDGLFIEKVCAFDARDIMFHRLYDQWFKRFPDKVRQTPWQTYPQHMPCPIKDDTQLTYQWADEKEPYKNRLRSVTYVAKLPKQHIVFKYFSRMQLMLAAVLHLSMIRDYEFIFTKVKRLSTYL